MTRMRAVQPGPMQSTRRSRVAVTGRDWHGIRVRPAGAAGLCGPETGLWDADSDVSRAGMDSGGSALLRSSCHPVRLRGSSPIKLPAISPTLSGCGPISSTRASDARSGTVG
eukprot:CAMPEP_0172212266 /NCGR_PEP_ID=MMETSP1050-20130122/36903_1 /TAXON_ID=233186 /ORGANISM="Cryptomonas curvata, Strain CCAP979/52" /LENGTH=111 /DNA_ID=CAMNT_0012892891 /DNA_START=270 /DNA_END=602 /DNA_ORIENTATION=+